MSLIPVFGLLLPVSVLVEDAKHEVRLQDKQLAAEAGLSPADWSKAKRGDRSLDLHRLAQTDEAFQRALYTRLLASLGQKADRDLVADLVDRVERLLAVVGRPAKAAIRAEKREVA